MANDLNKLLPAADDSSTSARSLYDGVGEADLVDEEIDERILRLIGLDDVFDIDYGTYISLLKERLIASRNFDQKLSSDEDELLVSEFKRVKGKVGRFKLKKKKITAESIGTTGPIQISRDKFFLASKAIVPVTPTPTEESSKDITDIEKALDAILKSLTLQNKEKKKRTEEGRRKSEDRRRRQREGDLEKPLSQLKSLAKKIIAPAQGILDRIFRFIKFTLLGYAFNQLVNWFNDPKNADKIKVLSRFLKDWWPSLLLAYGLFATPFGMFIRGTLRLLRGFIPQIASFLVKHPFLAATTAAAVGAYVMSQKNESYRDELKKTEPSIVTPKETRETGKTPGIPQLQQEQIFQRGLGGIFNGGGLVKRKSFFGGGEVQKELNINDIAFEGGGGITDNTGMRITGAGPDTQLIAAAPGEVVMSKKAVDKYGANFFLDLNKKAGGTNIPKIANNIQLAYGGGMVGKGSPSSSPSRSGGRVNNIFSTVSNIGKSVFQNVGGMIRGGGSGSSGVSSNSMNFGNIFSKGSTSQATVGNRSTGFSSRGFAGVSPTPSSSGFNSFMKPMNYNSSSRFEMKPPSVTNSNVYSEKSYLQPNIIQYNGPITKPKSAPPGPPVVISRTTYTVLPPIKAPSKAPSISRGSKLPAFTVSIESDSRSNIATKLGIRDLVGVA